MLDVKGKQFPALRFSDKPHKQFAQVLFQVLPNCVFHLYASKVLPLALHPSCSISVNFASELIGLGVNASSVVIVPQKLLSGGGGKPV